MSALISLIIVVIIYSHVYFFLWEARIVSIMPGLWYLGIFAAGITGGLIAFGRQTHAPSFDPRRNRQGQQRLLIWAVSLLGCALFSYLFSDRLPIQLRAIKTVVICVGLFGIFLFAFRGDREVRAARFGMLFVVLLSVATNVIDLSGMYSFSIAPGRAAGFYVNPNIAGFYLVMGMVLTVGLLSPRWRLHYCFLVGVGVTLTFSRSSVLMWLVALYGLSQMHTFTFSRKTLSVMWIGLVAMVLVVQFGENMVSALGLDEYLTENARSRIEFNMQKDESVQGRLIVAEKSWELIKRAPWTGHGLGARSAYGTEIEPHNMFLLIGVEMGALGLLLFGALFVLLWRKQPGISKVFAAVLFVGSLFSHNLLDQTALWLALALVPGAVAIHKPVSSTIRYPRATSVLAR
jgi:O-antigen ligase